jgi:aromatic ring-opening dioxygenase catalytic subunit (LigB family)
LRKEELALKQPSIFLPHGGGPCFFLDPPPEDPSRWVALERYLRELPASLPARPDALLVISAHWETAQPTLLAAAAPALLFDYYGFPPHTYRLTWPAPGAPHLAGRVRDLLADAAIECDMETERGYDHGVFVPLKVSYPDADMPILQLSLQQGLDPARHVAIGRALAPLRNDNIAIIGSGLSFHNLRALGDSRFDAPAAAFDDWLNQVLCEDPADRREAALSRWAAAPAARLAHPREEHLLPLMVAAGAGAGDPCRRVFSGRIWGKAVSAFQFG